MDKLSVLVLAISFVMCQTAANREDPFGLDRRLTDTVGCSQYNNQYFIVFLSKVTKVEFVLDFQEKKAMDLIVYFSSNYTMEGSQTMKYHHGTCQIELYDESASNPHYIVGDCRTLRIDFTKEVPVITVLDESTDEPSNSLRLNANYRFIWYEKTDLIVNCSIALTDDCNSQGTSDANNQLAFTCGTTGGDRPNVLHCGNNTYPPRGCCAYSITGDDACHTNNTAVNAEGDEDSAKDTELSTVRDADIDNYSPTEVGLDRSTKDENEHTVVYRPKSTDGNEHIDNYTEKVGIMDGDEHSPSDSDMDGDEDIPNDTEQGKLDTGLIVMIVLTVFAVPSFIIGCLCLVKSLVRNPSNRVGAIEE